MRHRLLTFLAAVLSCASVASAQSAPHFYRATSVRGAIAYQSAGDPSQFFYIPTETEEILGERLKEFRVSYYGVGEPFYVQNSATGKIESSVGAVMSATAIIDLSDATRKRLIAQITQDFKVQNPKLVPLPISEAKVRSLLLDGALSVSQMGQIVSSNPQFAREIRFSAGAKDNLFAQLLATSDNTDFSGVKSNPHFAVELNGVAEFVGDPWKVEVSCNLKQVWNQVRSSIGVSASLGWFRLGGAEYKRVNQDLEKSGACSYKETPGSLIDRDKNVLPLLEMTRRIFERLNTESQGGTGFFKFEPNPEAPPVSAGSSGSIWPWSVSVNLGYSSAHFTQNISWNTTVEIATRFNYPISASTSMAVVCGPATKSMFQDLRDTSENCIVQRKIDRLMQRLANEKTIVNRKLQDLENRLMAGTVTQQVYELLLKRWTTESQTEGAMVMTTTTVKALETPGKPVVGAAVQGVAVSAPTTLDEDVAWAEAESKKVKSTKTR